MSQQRWLDSREDRKKKHSYLKGWSEPSMLYTSHILLIRRQNDIATLENRLTFSYKVKHSLAIWPSNQILDMTLQEKWNCMSTTKTWTQMFHGNQMHIRKFTDKQIVAWPHVKGTWYWYMQHHGWSSWICFLVEEVWTQRVLIYDPCIWRLKK